MQTLRRWLIQIQSFLLSFVRRSFSTHASVRISDLTQSLDFYRRLGFRQVRATRGEEVVLLRNHRGDELNLVLEVTTANKANKMPHSPVSFRVENLIENLEHLQSWYPDLEITNDATTKSLQLVDPDNNVVEYYEQIDPAVLTRERIYHIATQPELIAGLSTHYYLPPDKENRFVRARARTAFIALACKRVAAVTEAPPLIIELDESELSIESPLFDDSDLASADSSSQSAYPHVNTPIPIRAINAVGLSEARNGEFLWPTQFGTVDAIAAQLSN